MYRLLAIVGSTVLVVTLALAAVAQERGKPDRDSDARVVYPSLSVDAEAIRSSPASEKCFKCHGAEAESIEWALSGHAHNLEALRAATNGADSCLGCHSSGFRPTSPAGWGLQRSTVTVTLATAINEVACSSCHSHAYEDNEDYLIRPAAMTCVGCHKMDCGCAGKGIIHQSQSEMFTGTLGRGVLETPSKHAEKMNGDCAVCHMYRPPDSEGIALESGGHTFKATMESCVPCHDDAQERRDNAAAEIGALLAEAEDALAENVSKLQGHIFDSAKNNIDMVKADAGIGFHNPTYARLLLERAIEYTVVGASE
ncbi:MAG: cytochrome c3 family protein [Candidatus Poribacteria bacterium]